MPLYQPDKVVNLVASNTTYTSGSVIFSGGGNITVGTNANTITISAGDQKFSAGVSNVGNTAGATGVSGTRLVLVGTNNVTLSQTTDANGNTISISAAGAGAGGFSAGVSNLGNTAGSTGVSGTRMVLVGTTNISLSQSTDANGNTVSFSANPAFSAGVSTAGNTAGSTGVSGTRLVLVGTGGITLSQSTDANGATVSVVPADVTYSYFNPQDAFVQVLMNQGLNTLQIQPMQAPNVQFDRVVIPAYMSVSGTSTWSVSLTWRFGVYTRNASTLSLLSSVSLSTAITYGSTGSASFGGIRLHTLGLTGTLSASQYWVGVVSSTATGGAAGTLSNMMASQLNTNFSGIFGAVSSATQQYTRGLGSYTVTTGAIPASIAFSQINGTNSAILRQPLFYLVSGTV